MARFSLALSFLYCSCILMKKALIRLKLLGTRSGNEDDLLFLSSEDNCVSKHIKHQNDVYNDDSGLVNP